MALILHNHTMDPHGQFDVLDAEVSSFKGGEVCTLVGTNLTTGDKAAADVLNDGYIPLATQVRPAVSKATLSSSSNPVFLADDGIANYGTLFGTVVGGTAGQLGGPTLGPASSVGSGKMTLWSAPGVYGVTLDAVDTTTGGLIPATSLTVGQALYYTSAGLLTTAANKIGSGLVVGTFIEFETNGSLVTTSPNLVASLNSPSGDVSSTQQEKFYQAVFYWRGSYLT